MSGLDMHKRYSVKFRNDFRLKSKDPQVEKMRKFFKLQYNYLNGNEDQPELYLPKLGKNLYLKPVTFSRFYTTCLSYPEYFDILILRDQAAVQVRDNKIEAILPLADYRYSGVPVVNGRGFAVNVKSQKDLQAFLDGYGQGETDTEFWNHWLTFGTYRKVIFHENYWEI